MSRPPARRRSRAFRERRLAILRASPVCHLCGEDIDLDLKYPHPKSGTVDHVIPFSKGGSDHPSNLRPAHAECNRKRQAKDLAEVAPLKRSRDW